MSVFEPLSPESIASLSEFFCTLGATDEQLAQITEKLRAHTGISTKAKGSMGGVERFTDGVVPASADQLTPYPSIIALCRTIASKRDMEVFLQDHNPIALLLSISTCPLGDLITQIDQHTSKREGVTPTQFLNCDVFGAIRIPTYRKAGELIGKGKFVEAYALHFMSIELVRILTGNTRWIIATEAKQLANDISAMCAPVRSTGKHSGKAPASAGAGGAATQRPSKAGAAKARSAPRASNGTGNPSEHTLAAAAGMPVSKPPAKPSGKAVCHDFNIDTQDGCRHGKNCRYLHQARPATAVPPTTSSLAESAPEPVKPGEDCFGESA